jgi:cyclase
MEADELIILDIEASRMKRDIDWDTISDVSNEAFMPVCYGGGITRLEQAEKLFRIGIEKVSLNTCIFQNSRVMEQIACKFGSQSVVATLDVQIGKDMKYHIFSHSGTCDTGLKLDEALRLVIQAGAGEIMINHIDRDGMMNGYDLPLMAYVLEKVGVPVIACGGCGGLNDIRQVTVEAGVSAAAVGSLFVYWGRLKGILINYPKREKLIQTFHD